ncbi:MAG: TIGR02281 family clan AA aspartic protease [Mesorhizobium sp.]|nr:TIGR02281 family clan AA aspartic protease [Mesorhizobium sp.]MCO5160903.1 TIGR02281 family clan AA aspartic protease [Mesorhizobium sp.]
MRNVILIGAFLGLSASVPILYQASPETFHGLIAPEPETAPAVASAPVAKPAAPATTAHRKVSVPADRTGHFRTELRFNGRKIEGLIDTGATLVAMNETTARKVGVSVSRSDFKYDVNTANGKARAAVVRIETIEIGRIRIEDVDAVVLEDKSLRNTLIGMSLLKQLARFEVKDEVLVLEQ